ncbi:heme peroxidase [Boletus edulis BED1]|uniref:Heme peroxidase n=1 Tax=Boletus edulis BED1 TaxID=1328754 RepID=A0AAD4GI33_BOLED|nr:heme peroxidase [Boletus edulis BED1]
MSEKTYSESMQQPHSNDFRRARKEKVRSAVQLLLARAQSSISNATSTTHLSGTLHDIKQIAHRGPPLAVDDLPAFADAIVNLHGTINDREFLATRESFDADGTPSRRFNIFQNTTATSHQFIDLPTSPIVYKDLPHPPTGFLSTFHNASPTTVKEQTVSYAFRSADGSNYNVLFPSLGMAGQPYARSVPSTHIQALSSLPDPGVVFERLLRRRDNDFIPHPGGLSSLFFAFADIIIHNIFNTNASDWTINEASSYVDLSIIYGSGTEQVDNMRKKDGTGQIWDDGFADSRLLFMPPSVCVLAVLFSRHHNYVAQKILALNEGGSFTSPPPDETAPLLAQDDEIFHRARLVNTTFFVRIVLADYAGCILGLVRDGLTWRLDPLAPFRKPDHDVSPRGQGNVVSIEFNFLYRWHAAVSEEDEKWLNELVGKLFDHQDPTTVTIKELRDVVREKVVSSSDAQTWTFGGLQRGPDGRFSDNDLARLLQEAIERRAGAFRARGCPAALRPAEILAIEQGRKWAACTLNEFRKFIGLRPYKSFQEWNPDPVIHSAAEEIYGHIDNLELYVGVQAEETKPPMPGAGLCPGYTISRAILSDAVCLTRGDRFLTVDLTPYNLTSWGYQHCTDTTDNGSCGGMLNKLLFHLLPDQFPAGSTYVHFPFLTPDFMRQSLASWSTDLHYYDFRRPSQVENSEHQLNKLYMRRVEATSEEVGRIIVEETCPVASVTKMFSSLVEKASISANHNTRVVDITKDVINQMSVYWATNSVLGLPVTVFDSILAGHTVTQWYELFADVTRYVYLNDNPVHDWTLYRAALKATNGIMRYLRNRLKRHSDGKFSLGGAADMLVTSLITGNVQNDRFIAKVLEGVKQPDIETIAYSIFAETVPSALLFSATISSVVDYYADPGRKDELQKLIQLSTAPGDGTEHRVDEVYFSRIEKQPARMMFRTDLMSRDLFMKLAPRVVTAIFSLKNTSFPEAQMVFDGGLPASKVIQIPDLPVRSLMVARPSLGHDPKARNSKCV